MPVQCICRGLQKDPFERPIYIETCHNFEDPLRFQEQSHQWIRPTFHPMHPPFSHHELSRSSSSCPPKKKKLLPEHPNFAGKVHRKGSKKVQRKQFAQQTVSSPKSSHTHTLTHSLTHSLSLSLRTEKLQYIKGLGCRGIWISPVFQRLGTRRNRRVRKRHDSRPSSPAQLGVAFWGVSAKDGRFRWV